MWAEITTEDFFSTCYIHSDNDASMYIFKTIDGVEHLGEKDVLTNPCGDYTNPYDAKTGFLSWDCEKFFLESEVVESRLLPELDIKLNSSWPAENVIPETRELIYQMPIELSKRIDGILRGELPYIVKAWVMLNCECDSTIYIGPNASVSSKGKLTIKADAKIPLYIHFETGIL